MGINDKAWMFEAYQLALKAETQGEVPIGAVVVLDNKVIGLGHNQVIASHDPCAHAEILALKSAALSLQNHRLTQCTIYTTLEPCAMCAGAMVHSRIARLVFACRDFKAGAAGSVLNLLQGYPLNHKVIIDEGVLQTECSILLKQFFQSKRLT